MGEGWPEGWVRKGRSYMERVDANGDEARVGVRTLIGGRCYAEIYTHIQESHEAAMEMARRAVWAMEPRKEIDREELARALHNAYEHGDTWGDRTEDTRQAYLAEADEAIRLLSGTEARVARIEALTKIEELERRNAALTATANAAVERAEKAEAHAEEVSVHLHNLLRRTEEAEVRAAKAEKALIARDAKISALQDAALKAQERAQRAEAERDVLRDYDCRTGATMDSFVEPAEDLRAENQRLRQALTAALRGTREIATSAAILAGDDDV